MKKKTQQILTYLFTDRSDRNGTKCFFLEKSYRNIYNMYTYIFLRKCKNVYKKNRD